MCATFAISYSPIQRVSVVHLHTIWLKLTEIIPFGPFYISKIVGIYPLPGVPSAACGHISLQWKDEKLRDPYSHIILLSVWKIMLQEVVQYTVKKECWAMLFLFFVFNPSKELFYCENIFLTQFLFLEPHI